MADEHYRVRKVRGQKAWSIKDRRTGKEVAKSTKSKHAARVSAHIRGDNSRRYNGKKFKG